MEVTTQHENGTLVAIATGRIDSRNAREFETVMTQAIDAESLAVVLDLEGLSYISSAGLRAILVTAKQLQKQKARFVLCALQDSIKEVMEMSGFSRIIPIHVSRSAALSALGGLAS